MFAFFKDAKHDRNAKLTSQITTQEESKSKFRQPTLANIENIVKNLFNRPLTSVELNLLQNCLNSNLQRKLLKVEEILPALEQTLWKLTEENATQAELRI